MFHIGLSSQRDLNDEILVSRFVNYFVCEGGNSVWMESPSRRLAFEKKLIVVTGRGRIYAQSGRVHRPVYF